MAFYSLFIPGIQKNLKDVIAAYLLYRCKHLSMLEFRVVSPSLAKKYIYCTQQAILQARYRRCAGGQNPLQNFSPHRKMCWTSFQTIGHTVV